VDTTLLIVGGGITLCIGAVGSIDLQLKSISITGKKKSKILIIIRYKKRLRRA
jgi:uncharacterized ion transporter superfamily protein YfcC